MNSTDYSIRFKEPYGIVNMSCRPAILKKSASNGLNSGKPLTRHLNGAFSRFRISPGRAETLVRCLVIGEVGKTNQCSIANLSATSVPKITEIGSCALKQHECIDCIY